MKIISHPQLEIDDEFISICRQIKSEGKSNEEWSAIESSDMFQSAQYCGGYEGIEEEFCFSYFGKSGKEWWFQLSLLDIESVIDGKLRYLDLNEPS